MRTMSDKRDLVYTILHMRTGHSPIMEHHRLIQDLGLLPIDRTRLQGMLGWLLKQEVLNGNDWVTVGDVVRALDP